MKTPNTYRVQQFSRSANTYTQYSKVQQQIAKQLITYTKQSLGDISLNKGVELGCGTGNLTKLLFLTFPKTQWLISDASQNMLEICEKKISQSSLKTAFQLEQLDAYFWKSSCDIVISNTLVQWLDLNQYLKNTRDNLSLGGYCIFSCFGKSHFKELYQILQEPPFEIKPIVGLHCSTLLEALEKYNFKSIFLATEEITANYLNAIDFFKNIKKFGGSSGKPQLSHPHHINLIANKYNRLFKHQNSVIGTWNPIYVIAQKLN